VDILLVCRKSRGKIRLHLDISVFTAYFRTNDN
jgi:hypothetical protein